MDKLNLNGHLVGPGELPYVIAEIGANHNGDMNLARQLIDMAKSCGANAAKFQSWSTNSLISKAEYARNPEYKDKKKHFGSLEAMVEAYQLTKVQHRELSAYCRQVGIDFLSSGFSPEEIDMLEELKVPAFKIASMDINHLPLLKYVASKGKPVLLSTGMATLGEIERAIHILQGGKGVQVGLLHCISIYPPEFEDIHLRNMATLQQAFDLPVGFSDHSLGISIPLAAIALGACVIEKHFTLDKQMDGWDQAISADPVELRTIVQEGRNIFKALGSTVRTVSPEEYTKRKKFRRRIVAGQAMKKGEVVSESDFNFKRPGTGIHPDELDYLVGRKLNRDVHQDDELEWADFS